MKYTLNNTGRSQHLWLRQEDGTLINHSRLKLVANLKHQDCFLMGKDDQGQPIVISGEDITLDVNCHGGISVKGTWPRFEITNWHSEDKEPRRLNNVQSLEILSDRVKDIFAHVTLDFAVPNTYNGHMNVRTQL